MEQHWCSASNKFQQPETPAAVSINPTYIPCYHSNSTTCDALYIFKLIETERSSDIGPVDYLYAMQHVLSMTSGKGIDTSVTASGVG